MKKPRDFTVMCSQPLDTSNGIWIVSSFVEMMLVHASYHEVCPQQYWFCLWQVFGSAMCAKERGSDLLMALVLICSDMCKITIHHGDMVDHASGLQ